MKINFYKTVFSFALVLLSMFIVDAQTATILEDGIIIATKLQKSDSSSLSLSGFSIAAKKVNDTLTEHRILVDKINKTYFGYDLKVVLDTENSRFKVSIKPLSLDEQRIQRLFDQGDELSKKGNEMFENSATNKLKIPKFPLDNLNIKNLNAGSLPKYPNEIIVGDDDVIALDILENPQTKEKITDLIRVTAKTKSLSLSSLFSDPELPHKDFSLLNAELQLLRYEVFINGEKKAEFKGGAVGPLLSFYVAGKGLCIFSLFPREEYTLGNITRQFIKEARIEENKIFFKIGKDEYKIVARSPILSQGGNWNLWLMHIPEYKPSQYTFLYRKDFAFYGTDYMNVILSKADGKR